MTDSPTGRCGYTITWCGEEQPCDQPATGWRWYQGHAAHEDLLDVACAIHENEGGRRLQEAEAKVARVEALHDALVFMGNIPIEERPDGLTASVKACTAIAGDLRAALDGVA